MHVIATAGHVDHGKSALLRALTGMEPDRWEEERRRGLTIDLGFVWTDTWTGVDGPVAFVDVPGHERFVSNMLAGVGPAPAVLFAVAADEGWMPQSAEHLTAIAALGVRDAVLVVTKSDLADPGPARADALRRLRAAGLRDVTAVAASARTGAGVEQVRDALRELVRRLPAPDPAAPVRLWADRSFTMRGAGAVVTGTLAAGTISAGDEFDLVGAGRRVVARGVQALGRPVETVSGVARVAVNLRGVRHSEVRRGDALATPGSCRPTSVADVRLASEPPAGDVVVHVGSASVSARVRPLGGDVARLALRRPLPLRVGDRLVLRAQRRVAGGALVLDPMPPRLSGRGAARRRAEELAGHDGAPDGVTEVRRRRVARAADLRAIGVPPPTPPLAGDWLVDPDVAVDLGRRIAALVERRQRDPEREPLEVSALAGELGLPDPRLVAALLPPGLSARQGKVVRRDAPDALPDAVRRAVAAVLPRLRDAPFAPPTAAELARLGLGAREIALAARAGRLVRLAPGVVVAPESIAVAVDRLRALPQPFSASQARQALGGPRRVVIPLLEHLASVGATRRRPDGAHTVRD